MTQKQNNNFEAIKAEILRRAKEARACTGQYSRAYKADTLPELLNVVKDNFSWCANTQVLDAELIEKYRDEFAANQIYLNVDVTSGYLLANDSATVKACGSATVEACGSATVKAWDSATVKAWGSATVKAHGSATVEAYGSATVEAHDAAYCYSYDKIHCELHDGAIHRVLSTNEIYYSSDSLRFVKQP